MTIIETQEWIAQICQESNDILEKTNSPETATKQLQELFELAATTLGKDNLAISFSCQEWDPAAMAEEIAEHSGRHVKLSSHYIEMTPGDDFSIVYESNSMGMYKFDLYGEIVTHGQPINQMTLANWWGSRLRKWHNR